MSDEQTIRTYRVKYPTFSFTGPQDLWDWVTAEAARRGCDKSTVVRDALEAAKHEQEAAA